MIGRIPHPHNSHNDPELDWRDQAIRALEQSRAAVADWKISRPGTAASLIPVVGPAWEAAADIQDGNYSGAALNLAFAAGDALPWGSAAKIVRLGNRIGWDNLVRLDLRYRKARELLEKAGYIRPGQEVHHTREVGRARHTPDWRNNPLMLKPMAKPDHRRIRGRWDGQPKHSLPAKIWHSTNHWQKSLPVGAASYAGDAIENRVRSSPSAQTIEQPRSILDPNRPIQVERMEQGFMISNKRR